MSAPKVSFLVPLFNHVQQTREMLASLLASLPQDLHFELIFADDASSDGTRKWLSTLSDPRIQIALNERNLGYAKTNNVAAALATGHYLALLNNDLVFAPGWFEPMLRALESPEHHAGIVGNLQYRVLDKGLDHAGVVLTPRGQFDHLREEPSHGDQAREVYVTTGACMLMRRADFEAVGGFDDVFVNGCEDIDLCLKIRAGGKKIYVAPNSKILHHVSLSRSRSSLQNEKNSHYLYGKWRKEIKLQLTKNWIGWLAAHSSSYAEYIDGVLENSFKSKPHIAAMAVSEAALLREEARWARELGTASVANTWINNIKVTGLRELPQRRMYLADAEVSLHIDHIKTARNFYLCARLLDDFEPATIAIDLSVNGVQKKTCRLTEGRVINVGIIDPLIFPNAKNHFKAEFYFIDNHGMALKLAPNVMLISHFVVDDEVVRPI
jgi:GT2 family glycosyltransferase